MVITLPNGIIDGVDHFDRVTIDEIRGKQQNYLADKDLVVGNIGHIPKLLEDLILSLQTEQGLEWQGTKKELVSKLCAGDLETILIKIRENTYGPKFFYNAQCTHCNHENKELRLDLDTLELSKFTLEQLMDNKSRTTVLPKTQKEVEFKPLYMRDMFELIKIANNKSNELITSSLSLFIKRIGDNSKITSKDIEQLPAMDIQHLNEVVANMKLEGSIDNEIITECESCKKEFSSKLNVYDPSFFAPSKGYKTINI